MSFLTLTQVSKAYGAVQVVKPLSLEFQKGELVTLLGPSGCGKTTLLRLIAGLERVTSGTITMEEREVTHLSAGERNVSMVFQSYALFPHMKVIENVSYGLISSGLKTKEAQEKGELALSQVGLAGFSQRYPHELSGGQQQRVALARALVLEPAILLFDEPLSNLDTRLRRAMREEIRSLQQKLGLTAVYVTHDQGEALAVSDRIIVMQAGEIAGQGSPQELYEHPKTHFIASFMGEANAVKGEIINGKFSPSGHKSIIIRPESISFTAQGLEAKVTSVTYMGANYEYKLATQMGEIFCLNPAFHAKGENIHLDFALKGMSEVLS
jgi:iron(III) transport system ATP-binding protein